MMMKTCDDEDGNISCFCSCCAVNGSGLTRRNKKTQWSTALSNVLQSLNVGKASYK